MLARLIFFFKKIPDTQGADFVAGVQKSKGQSHQKIIPPTKPYSTTASNHAPAIDYR
jgi:hypothetical protein